MSLWIHNTVRQVREHHRKQFGRPGMTVRALKLCEEAGEVAGAVIRHATHRDGRDWKEEVKSEIEDVLITLMTLSGDPELNLDFCDLIEDAAAKFCNRKWEVTKWTT